MLECSHCSRHDFKSKSGLSSHIRNRHPEPPAGPVETAVREDIARASGPAGLKASALKLARTIDDTTSARELPRLAGELRIALSKLGLDPAQGQEADAVDELGARRAARRAEAADTARPAGRKQRRRGSR